MLDSQGYLARGGSSSGVGSAAQQKTTDGKQTIQQSPFYVTQVLSRIVLYLRKL